MLAVLVSFSREVMPILALFCANCHGLPTQNPAANLSVRTYAGLMQGGNFGPVIVPGNPEESPLIHFIDGRRGAGQRMPMNAPPLKSGQIDLIRRWIEQGAKPDREIAPTGVLSRAINTSAGDSIGIGARVPPGCFVTVEALDIASQRQLWIAEQASGPELQWTVRTGTDWPRKIQFTMTVRYCANSGKSRFSVIRSQHAAMLKYRFPGGYTWQ